MTDRIDFLLRGRMLEKFVDRAMHEGILFQAVGRTGDREMRLSVSSRDAARLLRLAEEYRMDLQAVSQAGLPRWRKKFRERWTMALGLLLGMTLLTAFSSCIWRVEAVSLDGAADDATLRAIRTYAEAWGAKPGVLKRDVDRDALSADIQLNWPEMTHVSVRLSGVFLRIETAREESAPEVYEASASRDLVASRDALVVHVEPLAGKASVQPGDTVRRGQVLIRGEERIDTEATRGIRALGQVIGRVWFTAECRLPLMEKIRTRTGSSRVSAEIRMGDWFLTLSEAEDYPCQEIETESLPIGGLYLPVRIERVVRWEAEENIEPLNRENLMAQGEARALEMARAKLPAGAVESACWVDFTENDGMITARATVEAQMDIACDRSELNGGLNE